MSIDDQDTEVLNASIDMNITPTLPSTSQEQLKPKQLFSEARGTLKEINTVRVEDLTPKKKLLYHSNKKFKQKTLVLRKRCLTAKQRILKAKRYMKNNLKSLNRLNNFTQKFVQSQMRIQPQKPRGRRFTLDDKVFALSLYK